MCEPQVKSVQQQFDTYQRKRQKREGGDERDAERVQQQEYDDEVR